MNSPSSDSGYISPEQKARQRIDATLERAGWVVQDYKAVNLYAGLGVAVRELPTGSGPADYVLLPTSGWRHRGQEGGHEGDGRRQ